MPRQFRPYRASTYWDRRYRDGRTSGEGSEGAKAVAKARHITDILSHEFIVDAIDWGVGDGVVLAGVDVRKHILGVDVSPHIVDTLNERHADDPNRIFALYHNVRAWGARADLAISSDVLFHFPDETAFIEYIDTVFRSARQMVIIHARDVDEGQTAAHVHWRTFTPVVTQRHPEFNLVRKPSSPETMGWYHYYREAEE